MRKEPVAWIIVDNVFLPMPTNIRDPRLKGIAVAKTHMLIVAPMLRPGLSGEPKICGHRLKTPIRENKMVVRRLTLIRIRRDFLKAAEKLFDRNSKPEASLVIAAPNPRSRKGNNKGRETRTENSPNP